MKTKMLAIGLGASLLASAPAQAWNGRGHMMVAAVAWEEMTPKARARAAALLRQNPNYADWVKDVPAALADKVAFMNAATWPDDIRSTHQDDGYDPTAPQADDNVGYKDPYVHAYWHFTNIAFSIDATPVPPRPAVNAIERIKLFGATLTPSGDDDVQSYDLVWLAHLVGDMHQPLHATSRYSQAKKRGDNGGNGVFVCKTGQCGKGQKLHQFWDYGVGSSQDYASVIAAANKLPKAPASQRAISDPEAWLQESYQLARTKAYVDPVGPAKGPYVLTTRYRVEAGQTCETQVALAGARLADLLNARFA